MSAADAIARLRFLGEGALSVEPPPRLWLLRDADSATPAVPLGEVGLIVGAGGTSKTYAAIALAVAVALGGRWLDSYQVDHAGRVALFLAEETSEECQRRLYYVSEALGLDADARRLVEQRVLVAPLAGVSARLAVQGGGDADVARAFYDRLGELGDWRLVMFDSLSRFGGADTEVNNAAAADFIKILERFVTLPGTPTVACIHHTSQNSRDGRIVGATAARGVTALVDNVRWAIAMSADDNGIVTLRVVKSNYGPTYPQLPELALARGAHGVLRPATVEELATASEKRKAQKGDKGDTGKALESALLAEARKHPTRYTSKTRLAEAVTGTKAEKLKVIARLVEEGRLHFGPEGCRIEGEVIPFPLKGRDP